MSTVFLPLPTLVATVGDPGRTRIVIGTVVVLILIGSCLAVAAIWLLRATRTDPEVLAPLELMGARRWRRATPDERLRRLDEVRPPGASPLGRPAPAPPDDLEEADHDVGRAAGVEPADVDVIGDATAGSSEPIDVTGTRSG